MPPGTTLISLIERNIANVGASVAYRYLDYTRSPTAFAVELTWTQLGRRMRAIGAEVQRFHLAETEWRFLLHRVSTTSPASSPQSRRGP